MSRTGLPCHLDISAGDPTASIEFYHQLLTTLGYTRRIIDSADWVRERPDRATWALETGGRICFEVEVRPARRSTEGPRPYDRYAPGPHHFAFSADSARIVENVHRSMREIGANVLDPPADYGGRPGYGNCYFAAFFADPDGFKIEVVWNGEEG